MSENKDIENLKKNLFYTPKHAAQVMTAEQIADADEYGEEYKQFLNTAKTEREAVSEAVRLAEKAGFVPFDRTARLKPGDKVYLNNRGKSLLLAVIGTTPEATPFIAETAPSFRPKSDWKTTIPASSPDCFSVEQAANKVITMATASTMLSIFFIFPSSVF